MNCLTSYPFFWGTEEISSFWKDLLEILKQKNNKESPELQPTLTKIVSDLNSKNNKSKVISSANSSGGWLDMLSSPVGEYLNLYTLHSGSKYDGHSLYQLLRAYRNLSTHSYGGGLSREEKKKYHAQDLKRLFDLSPEVQEHFKDGGVSFWTNHFPELLLITYDIGFEVCAQVNNKVVSKFRKRFYGTCGTINNIPVGLSTFSEKLTTWIYNENHQKTGLWLYSVSLPTGGNILFLKLQNNSKVHLGLREVLVLNCLQIESGTKSICINRYHVSCQDEDACMFNAVKSQTLTDKYLKEGLKFQFVDENETRFPFVVVTDVLPTALAICSNTDAHSKRDFVVFTHHDSSRIHDVVEQFFKSREINVQLQTIYWNDLKEECKTGLLKRTLPLHKNSPSNLKTKLDDLCTSNKGRFTTLHGNTLLNIIHGTSPTLLQTNLDPPQNYVHRFLYDGKGHPIQDGDFIKEILQMENTEDAGTKASNKKKKAKPGKHNIIIISDIAGMGKSTLLSHVGQSFEQEGKLVKLITAKDMLRQMSEPQNNSSEYAHSLEQIWGTCSFELCVVMYALKTRNLGLSLFIDGLDEIEDDTKYSSIFNLVSSLFHNHPNSNITVCITTRPHLIPMVNNMGLANVHYYSIEKLDQDNKIECITKSWSKFRKSDSDDEILESIARKCIEACEELGEFADTPFACNMISSVYEKYAKEFTEPSEKDMYRASELFDIFSDRLLREHMVKHVQKSGTPKHMLLSGTSIDMSSTVFKHIKSTYYMLNSRMSFEKRFPKEQSFFQNLNGLDIFNISQDGTKGFPFPLADPHQGTFGDYFIASCLHHLSFQTDLNVQNYIKDFIERHVFQIDLDNNCLKQDNIVRFFNSFLNINSSIHFLNDFPIPENLHDILYHFLCNKYDKLFIALCNVLDDNKYYGSNACWDLHENSSHEEHAGNLLDFAVNHNMTKVIDYLVHSAGLNVDTLHPRGITALRYALNKPLENRDGIVECLLRHKADLGIRVRRGGSIFEMACGNDDISESTIRLLVRAGDHGTLRSNWSLWVNAVNKSVHAKHCKEYEEILKIENGDNTIDTNA